VEADDVTEPDLFQGHPPIDFDPEGRREPWPMPEPREWAPMPRATLLQRLKAIFCGVYPE
jgi:hypothetical protein